MPPADNTRFLLEASQQRSKQARQRAEDAIAAAGREHHGRVSMVGIARAAAISRSWLYTQPDLVAAIKTLQKRQPSPARTGPQPASEASLLRRLDATHERNKQLRAQVADLTRRLEAAHGEIRRLQATHQLD